MNSKELKSYQNIFNNLKDKIKNARLQAVLTLNAHLLAIYWEIGKTISEQEKSEGWGAKIVDTLSKDLKSEFPDMRGLSLRNLRYMRDFAEAYPQFPNLQVSLANLTLPISKTSKNKPDEDPTILQVPLAKLSWYHHITLLDKIKNSDTRLFYIQKTIENGWGRDVMVHQIEGGLHKRQGQLSNNFSNTIASPQSELVEQVFKDPYMLDFIYLGKEAKERDLEDALIAQITKFLLELGQWFAFMGRQYKITLGKNEYFFDLLFYHTRLKRYIIIDLKIDEFKREYIGKMNFYLNLADERLKQTEDEKSIGLVLCKTKDGLVAEYALRNTNKPIGITEYKINEKLPENIKNELPSIEDIERRMEEKINNLEQPVNKKIDRLKELIVGLKQEEVKEKRNHQNTKTILNSVILPVKKSLQKSLSEILFWFENAEISIWTDNIDHKTENAAKKHLEKHKSIGEFHIEIRLKGFIKAGDKAFDCRSEIYFVMNEYQYSIGFTRKPIDIMLTKLYHQLPTPAEFNDISNKVYEAIIDQITRQVELLINNS